MRAVRLGKVSLLSPRSPGTLPSAAPGSSTLALPRSSRGSVHPGTVPVGLARTPWGQAQPKTAPTPNANAPPSGVCCAAHRAQSVC